ncbi:MAG TPA: hypothetical protein ENN88_01965 [Candidatus Coatesbacteria bacterium]|nr:hypothetical protein [Candidatus Coatesbacteria bacterium]
MSYLIAIAVITPLAAPATTPPPVSADPQTVEQLVESLAYALNTADVELMLELHWTPAWDQLTEEGVAAAREEAATANGPERLREAQEKGDLPLSVQMAGFTLYAEFVEMRLLFHYATGGFEEETRRAVWRKDGWRLLADRI